MKQIGPYRFVNEDEEGVRDVSPRGPPPKVPSGSYPAWPCQPDTLTRSSGNPNFPTYLLMALEETDRVFHSYIGDESFSDCVMVFEGGEFYEWWPVIGPIYRLEAVAAGF